MRIKNAQGITIDEDIVTLTKDGYAPYIDIDNTNADIIILSYQPGFGKTYTAIEYMKKKGNENTFYFTNRHDTIDERIKDWSNKNKPLPTHWKGFEKSCKIKNKKKYYNLGVPTGELCKRCSSKSCTYKNQFNTKDRVFSPVEYLKILNDKKFNKTLNHLKTIFIDEQVSKVVTSYIDVKYVADVFSKILTKNAQYTKTYINEISKKNFGYFGSKEIDKIRKRYYKTITESYNKQDIQTLKDIKKFKPSEFQTFIEWWNIYKNKFPKRESFGIPYYYYAFDALNTNQSLKIVILDASFNKKLFTYFLYSYNGEKGFNRNINVKIFSTNESNKNTEVYRIKPNAWHPKASFTKKQYLEYTRAWLPKHIQRIKTIFGEDNVGIITFKELGEKSSLLGYNVEYYGNLRSKNSFEDKQVLVILGHFFPPIIQLDKNGNPKEDGIVKMIDEWFLRESITFSILELQDYFLKNYPSHPERGKRLIKRYLGVSHPRRYIDEPGKTTYNPNDPIKLPPVETIQEYFDDEIYQAVHRNRGLQNDRIIFLYCWIPPRLSKRVRNNPNAYQKIFSESLYKLWDEFEVSEIEEKDEDKLFKNLLKNYGELSLIKDILEDMKKGMSNKDIAKKYKIWKGPGGGLGTQHVKEIREKYDDLLVLVQKAKRRDI